MMIVSAFMLLIPVSSMVRASVTGDAYTAPFIDRNGNWLIQNATVYDGTDVLVNGNVYINGSGTLDILNCKLTMTEGSQYEFSIYPGEGTYIRVSGGTLDVTSFDPLTPWANIDAGFNGHIYLSNSTINYYWINPSGSNDYLDNCTLTGSYIEEETATGKTNLNVSYNSFDAYAGPSYVTVCSANSIVTGNEFISMTQNYDPSWPGIIYVNGGANTQAEDTKVIKNEFDMDVNIFGIFTNGASGVTISRNIFANVDGLMLTSSYTPAAAIYADGDGVGTSIDNNTIKNVETTSEDTYYQSAGIVVGNSGDNYDIAYNDIWNVVKLTNQWSGFGILYSGQHGEINHNLIGNVTGTTDDAYYMSAGIEVSGSIAVSNAFVNISRNSIDLLQTASNGMVFSGRSHGRIDNNTIGVIKTQSRGYGVYIADHDNGAATHVDILDNTITALWRDSCGAIITHNATDDRMLRNTITILTSGSFMDEEEAAIVVAGESWVAAPYNGANWTGDNCLVANNTIINLNGHSGWYPEYLIWNSYLTSHGANLRLIVNEYSEVRYNQSTFTLICVSDIQPSVIDTATGPLTLTRIGSTDLWTIEVNRSTDVDFDWLDITVYSTALNSAPNGLGAFIIIALMLGLFVMFAMSFVVEWREEKQPEVSSIVYRALALLIGISILIVILNLTI